MALQAYEILVYLLARRPGRTNASNGASFATPSRAPRIVNGYYWAETGR